jgi:hypothetical protein
MVEPAHGWILEWFEKDGDRYVDRVDLLGVDVGWLQALFDEPSVDDMMCYSYSVSPEQLIHLGEAAGVDLDPLRFDYFVSGWASGGYRTPGGLHPPPKDPPPFIQGAARLRPDWSPPDAPGD